MAYFPAQNPFRDRARSEVHPQRTYKEWDHHSQAPIPVNAQPSNSFLTSSIAEDSDSNKIVASQAFADDGTRRAENAPQLYEDVDIMNYLRLKYELEDHDVSWFEGRGQIINAKKSNSQVLIKRTSTRLSHAAAEARREIDVLNKVSDDSIQKLLEWMDGDTSIWTVLEHRELRSVGDLVRNVGIFPDEALKIALNQLFSGLSFLLLAGFAHLRLCDDTVCMDTDGQLVVRDFEYACEYGRGRQGDLYAATQEKYGQDIYVAPEIFANTTYNARKAVMWSCGVLVYFMATGQTDKLSNLDHPSFEKFGGQQQSSSQDPYNNPTPHPRRRFSVAKAQSKIIIYPNRFSVPDYAREVIPKMLVKEPRRRAELIEVASRIPKIFEGRTLRPLMEVAWLDYKTHAGPYADLHAPEANESSASSIYSAVSNLSNPFSSLMGRGHSRRQSVPVTSRYRWA